MLTHVRCYHRHLPGNNHDVRQHAGLGHGQHDEDMNQEDMLPLRQAFKICYLLDKHSTWIKMMLCQKMIITPRKLMINFHLPDVFAKKVDNLGDKFVLGAGYYHLLT